jgi:hypothetical protein
MTILYYHTGKVDFPHGAGASEPGYYVYDSMADDEPIGPIEATVAKEQMQARTYDHMIVDMPEAK